MAASGGMVGDMAITYRDKKLKAVLYSRVSTEEQQKGTSLRDQAAGNKVKADLIEAEIVASFEDKESGGFYLTRKGLQDALRTLEEKKANVLIVKDLVRLTRNDRAEQALIIKRIRDSGARMIFWDMEYEDSPLGQFSLNVTGDFAILEKAIIKDRTMRGRRRRAVEGVMPARSIAPFGYKLPVSNDIIRGDYAPDQLGKYLIDAERAPIAAEIFLRYAAGDSLHGICKWLQSSGVATVANGRFWRPSNIVSILENPAYYGKAAFGRYRMVTDETRALQGFKRRNYKVPVPEDEWTWIDCPAIVSKEIWDRCQHNRKTNRARLSTRPAHRILLTGLLRCPQCRRVMTGRCHAKNLVSHYRCKESSPSSTSAGIGCWNRCLNAKRLEALVIEAVRRVIRSPHAVEAAYQTYDALLTANSCEQEYERLQRELAELSRDEMATAKAQVSGIRAGANVSVYETLLRELTQKRVSVEQRVCELENEMRMRDMAQSPKDRASLIEEAMRDTEAVLAASPAVIADYEKNALLAKIIDHIYPDVDASRFTITFSAFDNSTHLIAECATGQEPQLRVINTASG